MFRWFGVSFATHRAIRYVYTRIYSNAFSISRIALTDREASLNTPIISPPSPPSLSPLPLNHREKSMRLLSTLFQFLRLLPFLYRRWKKCTKQQGVSFCGSSDESLSKPFPLTFEVIKCKWFCF